MGIKVDGVEVDASNYLAESGSVIVKLKPEYLETLAIGKHTITALFNDGNTASADFTILSAENKETNGGKQDPTKSPTKTAGNAKASTTAKTADENSVTPWLTLMIASLCGLSAALRLRREKPE